jgi:GntP family gluconate:H+ symporter
MMCAALIVGLPVFFEVGFVLLIPIAFTVARRTGKSWSWSACPCWPAFPWSTALVPPHPAAMLAVTIFHADVGRTILYALLIGIPAAAIAGPIYARFIAPRIVLDAHNPMAEEFARARDQSCLPGFGMSLTTILLPVVLMLIGSWAGLLARPAAWPTVRCTCWAAPTSPCWSRSWSALSRWAKCAASAGRRF